MEDYEKKYKEALERAKVVNPGTKDYNIVTEIFPELIESEDERIRKWCVSYFRECFRVTKDNVEYQEYLNNKVIPWLKKQGENPSIEGTFINVDDVRDNFVSEVYRVLDTDSTNERANQIIDAFDSLPTVAIEKQGEQKPTNKVEPKFKIGDWVVNKETGTIHQIKEVIEVVINHTYGYDTTGGGYISTSKSDKYHLWTIQDAKDGDVLTVNDNVFIYAHRKQLYSIAVAHCFVNSVGDFCFDGEFGYTERGNSIHPATKEQRDKLEKAITAAGYKWNKEDLKLEKI